MSGDSGTSGSVLNPLISSIHKRITSIAPHADRYDFAFGFVVFFLAGAGIHTLGGSAAIALVSAVTASVAIYRLRKPDDTKQPAVRQAFETNKDTDSMDFGFRNYGPGPALYLQVEATLGNSDERIFQIKPREYPLHLSEGEFLGLIHDDNRPDDSLLNEIKDVEGNGERLDEMVYFYYSYVSVSGVREPKTFPDEPKQDDETILEDLRRHSEKPRRMTLREIRQHCLDKTGKQTEHKMRH